MRVSYSMHIILASSFWMPTRLHCPWIEALVNAGVNLRVRLEEGCCRCRPTLPSNRLIFNRESAYSPPSRGDGLRPIMTQITILTVMFLSAQYSSRPPHQTIWGCQVTQGGSAAASCWPGVILPGTSGRNSVTSLFIAELCCRFQA